MAVRIMKVERLDLEALGYNDRINVTFIDGSVSRLEQRQYMTGWALELKDPRLFYGVLLDRESRYRSPVVVEGDVEIGKPLVLKTLDGLHRLIHLPVTGISAA